MGSNEDFQNKTNRITRSIHIFNEYVEHGRLQYMGTWGTFTPPPEIGKIVVEKWDYFRRDVFCLARG